MIDGEKLEWRILRFQLRPELPWIACGDADGREGNSGLEAGYPPVQEFCPTKVG